MARNLGVGVELLYLDVPTEELWRRVEARNAAPPWDDEPIERADLDEWMNVFQPPDADDWPCTTRLQRKEQIDDAERGWVRRGVANPHDDDRR